MGRVGAAGLGDGLATAGLAAALPTGAVCVACVGGGVAALVCGVIPATGDPGGSDAVGPHAARATTTGSARSALVFTSISTSSTATNDGWLRDDYLAHVKLLDYQAKEVLSSLGIAIPPGRVAHTADEAAAACAELGPVAVKAQVPVGGRGKAGGIKLAKTPDEARGAAQRIIGMDIKGFKVPLVYCETALDIEREIYLGFTVDRDARANVLLLSAKGGMDIEQVADETPDAIARLYPNPWRGPLDFELTQLAFDAGLGELARPLTALVKKLYRAIPDYDALTAEINPLVVARNGDVIAGDAKRELDDNAAW